MSLGILLLAACGGDGSKDVALDAGIDLVSDAAIAHDAEPPGPSISLEFPPPKSRTAEGSLRLIASIASDTEGLTATLNGAPLPISAATLEATLSLDVGENEFLIEVVDALGNSDSKRVVIQRQHVIQQPFTIQLDADSNTLYYVDVQQANLTAVDVSTGIRRIVSDNNTPNADNRFGDTSDASPAGFALDLANNRALVANRVPAVLAWVDLTSGVRTILSDATTPDSTNILERPVRIELDHTNDRALVLDKPSDTLVAVDLTTGARSILSGASIPSANPPLLIDATDLVVDAASNRALVAVRSLNAIVAVDLTSGVRTIFSQANRPNGGPDFDEPIGLGLDSFNNRVVVFNRGSRNLMAVDLTTGSRTVLSSNTVPDSVLPMRDIRHLVVDSANSRFLAADNFFDHVIAIDYATGERSTVSNNRFPDISAQREPQGIAIDRSNGDLFYTSSDSIFRLEPTLLESVLLSSHTVPDSSVPFATITDIAVADGRLLATGDPTAYLLSVDMGSGTRELISSSMVPDALIPIGNTAGFDINEVKSEVLVPDAPNQRLVAISTIDGARRIVSDSATPDDVMPLNNPARLVLDRENDRILVVDDNYDHLISVDPSTGARTAFPTLDAFNAAASALAISPNGDQLIVALTNRQLVSINLKTGVTTEVLPAGAAPDYIPEMLHLGRYVVVLSYQSIYAISIDDGQIVTLLRTVSSIR